ncbi:DUF2514 family protein [Methylibium sp.]|uniref:DUF2514 family protein n=1 Tax=Methylibium sp. TaxID=2067992 RepID=UPI003D149444
MFPWLSIIPGAAPWGLCLLLAASVGVQTLRVSKGETALATEQRDRRDERLRLAERALVANDQVRTEIQRRADEQQEVIRNAEKQQAQARTDALAAAAAARRLRERAAQLAAACGPAGPHPAPAGAGEATAGAGLVLTDVLGRSDDTSGELAEAFDAARGAGLACERAYDALRGPVPP